MAMDLGKTTKLLAFLRARIGSARPWTIAAAAAAADMDVLTCRASLGRLRRQGVIEHEPRDYSTIRIVRDPAASAAPPAPPRATKPHPSSVAGADPALPGSERTVVSLYVRDVLSAPGSLEDAIAVTYEPSEREQLGELVTRMQARAAELARLAEEQANDAAQVAEVYDALRASPPLGALGASLFGFLAQARAALPASSPAKVD